MYFAIAVIRLNKSKFWEKNCKFKMYLGRYMSHKSEYFGDNKPDAIFWNQWKFSIWNCFFFQKNVREKDILFKFLNSFYFPLGCGAKLILGTFWDLLGHFLKNIISQLWASHEWSYNRLKAVSSIKFKRS